LADDLHGDRHYVASGGIYRRSKWGDKCQPTGKKSRMGTRMDHVRSKGVIALAERKPPMKGDSQPLTTAKIGKRLRREEDRKKDKKRGEDGATDLEKNSARKRGGERAAK